MGLDVSFSIEAPSGWIELEDRENGYELHKEAKAERGTQWRKKEISSGYVEGTYVTEAVKENITEPVVVYVYGETPFELETRIIALTDAFDQLQYEIRMRNGDLLETWDCAVADYVVQSPQELINSTMAVVRATVPRRPSVTRAQV
jgi:hypothetical protein